MMRRFDDYYNGKPLLDGVLYKVVDNKQIIDHFQQGKIDIQASPRDAYQNLEKLENVNILQSAELAYEYIGFKLGKWDSEAEKIVMNNPKFADKRLRQAMYYALDRNGIINEFSYGLGKLFETPVPATSWAKIPDSEINTYPYDPEKAKTLLNEAGYIDVNGDGLREDPNGKKLVIHYDSMTGNQMAELRSAAILEDWNDIGLDVRVNGGQLKELNVFYDAVEEDDPSVELFNGVWGLSRDPISLSHISGGLSDRNDLFSQEKAEYIGNAINSIWDNIKSTMPLAILGRVLFHYYVVICCFFLFIK